MLIKEIITEAKPPKLPKVRNPVAKNANAAIGGGGAGAHKDKKKAAKQGEVKHKSKAFAETATAGSTSAGNVAVGVVYPNKKGKSLKNKDGTVKNAQDLPGNLLTGGSIAKR